MLDHNALQSASDLLYAQWMALGRIDHLPAACRPSTRAEGYAIQVLLEQRSAAPLYGWKIAATSAAGQAHIGVKGPMAGRILRERVVEPGTAISLQGNLMRVAELEFAFLMGQDLTPRAAPYERAEVCAAVASLHPAIEIPDSRYHDFVAAGEAQLIADNACAHLFLLGAPCSVDWAQFDLATYPVHATHHQKAGTTALTGSGANVLGDPVVALTWIANELSSLGLTLQKGQVVTTGTCLTPVVVAPGEALHADYGPIGRISASFA